MRSRPFRVVGIALVGGSLACQPSPACPFLVSHLDVQGLWSGLVADGGINSEISGNFGAEALFFNRKNFSSALSRIPSFRSD